MAYISCTYEQGLRFRWGSLMLMESILKKEKKIIHNCLSTRSFMRFSKNSWAARIFELYCNFCSFLFSYWYTVVISLIRSISYSRTAVETKRRRPRVSTAFKNFIVNNRVEVMKMSIPALMAKRLMSDRRVEDHSSSLIYTFRYRTVGEKKSYCKVIRDRKGHDSFTICSGWRNWRNITFVKALWQLFPTSSKSIVTCRRTELLASTLYRPSWHVHHAILICHSGTRGR